MTHVETSPRWKAFALWGVRGLLAAVFLLAGGLKIYGLPMMVQEFEHIGFGQWFRYLTGTLEVVGAVTILVPSLAAFGAVLLSCVMVGAIATHLFLVGGSPIPAVVLLVLSATIAFVYRAQIDAVFDRDDA